MVIVFLIQDDFEESETERIHMVQQSPADLLEAAIEGHLKTINSIMRMYWGDVNAWDRQRIIAKTCAFFVQSVLPSDKVAECLKLCGEMAEKYVENWNEEFSEKQRGFALVDNKASTEDAL